MSRFIAALMSWTIFSMSGFGAERRTLPRRTPGRAPRRAADPCRRRIRASAAAAGPVRSARRLKKSNVASLERRRQPCRGAVDERAIADTASSPGAGSVPMIGVDRLHELRLVDVQGGERRRAARREVALPVERRRQRLRSATVIGCCTASRIADARPRRASPSPASSRWPARPTAPVGRFARLDARRASASARCDGGTRPRSVDGSIVGLQVVVAARQRDAVGHRRPPPPSSRRSNFGREPSRKNT